MNVGTMQAQRSTSDAITCSYGDGGEPPCRNGGVCVKTSDQVTGAAASSCTCPAGFSGALCESAGLCDLQCQHGGSCRHDEDIGHDNAGSSFECECVGPYKGRECEILFATCPIMAGGVTSEVECLWGGTCVAADSADEYVCECPSDRYGASCENEFGANTRPNQDDIANLNVLGLCRDDNDCNNGGLCVLSHDAQNTAAGGQPTKRSQCLCPLGWGGHTCSLPCRTLDCQHGSSCRFDTEDISHANDASEAGAYCDCDEDQFKGRECEIAVQKCPGPSGVECLYGGACVSERPGPGPVVYTCVCPPGRLGTRCELTDPEYVGGKKVSQTLTVPNDPILFIIIVVGAGLLVFLPATVIIVRRSNKRKSEVREFTTEGGDDNDKNAVSAWEDTRVLPKDAQVV